MNDHELLLELLARIKMLQRFAGCDDEAMLREAKMVEMQSKVFKPTGGQDDD